MIAFVVFKIIFGSEDLLSNSTLQKLLRAFTTAVAVVIVSVPEGLPLAVSIAMAFSVDKMKDDKLLVKKMSACENLAFTNIICTGKTGTLTEGNMRVKQFFAGGQNYNFDQEDLESVKDELRALLIDCIIMNNDAKIEMIYNEEAKEGVYEPVGNSTEAAMLNFLYENKINVHEKLAERQRESEIECTIPFSPLRKRQVTVIRPYKGCDYVRVVVKGAPEYVFSLCNKFKMGNCSDASFSTELKRQVLDQSIIDSYAKEYGYRTFAYAYKDMDSDEWERLQEENRNFINEDDREIVEKDLTFVAAFGLQDNLRVGVQASINKLRKAKVDVRMISGDNLETAKHCAVEAGIITKQELIDDEVCMTGRDLMDILEEPPTKTIINGKETWKYDQSKGLKLGTIQQKCKVLARCTPEEKFAFIVALQSDDK